MNEQTQELIPAAQVRTVFTTPEGLGPYIQKIREEVSGFVPDVTTDKGRKAIASLAHKVAKSKTALDGIGKELVSKLKEEPKLVDAERRRMRDILDALRDDVRKPLTDWEEAEDERCEKHQKFVESITYDAGWVNNAYLADLQEAWIALTALSIDIRMEEYEESAKLARTTSLALLHNAIEKAKQEAADAAELEQLRKEKEARDEQDRQEKLAQEAKEREEREAQATKEREERIAKEAEERVQREADERAEAHRKASEAAIEKAAREAEAQRKADAEAVKKAQDDADRAKREAQEAIEAAAEKAEKEAEKERDTKAREQAEADALAADKEHQQIVNEKAIAGFMNHGISKEQSQDILRLIRDGHIPRVSIAY